MTRALSEREAAKIAAAVVVNVIDSSDFEARQAGQAACWPVGGGYRFCVVQKASLSPARVSDFEAWARQRVYMVALTGDPEVDGWFRRSDGGWQITARDISDLDLPSMAFLG